ncbi:MAG: hypothetical protein A2W31_16110 [Planctomycetes bacterium RBG_16_64_10]|nr:MAG: hypothetical protein A2W31_16110 [Planctomycetes bacterium RBG_16_64_10]
MDRPPCGGKHQVMMHALLASHAYTITEADVRTLRPLKITLLWVCLLGLPIVAFWLGGRLFEAIDVAKQCVSESKFAQLRVALLSYHEQHGSFPPTKYQPIPNGPVHSWRVLLVPYTDVEYKKRYSKYDFSQEWNSANNLQALARMPYFSYFSLDGAGNDITNYLAISNGDDWPAKKPLKSLLITRGKDHFLVVEYPDSKVHWMEPKY